jgi:hypothetical protein
VGWERDIPFLLFDCFGLATGLEPSIPALPSFISATDPMLAPSAEFAFDEGAADTDRASIKKRE